MNEKLKLGLGRVEKILGKGENASYSTSIFSFFHNVFKSSLFQGCKKSGLCGKEIKYSRKNACKLIKLSLDKI